MMAALWGTMKSPRLGLLLTLLLGCGSSDGMVRPPPPSPSQGATPAKKKELPWLDVMGGRMKTTLFYGPWQCNQKFMRTCERECASEGYLLMGCMWLVDIKLDWEGRLVVPPLPVIAGSRYPIFHCCCNYPPLSTAEKKPLRDRWEGAREGFRLKWSKKFGTWPEESNVSWPGHHIRDLWHGGDPVDPNNIIPMEPSVHIELGRKYPGCYNGETPWNTPGPDLPYTDN